MDPTDAIKPVWPHFFQINPWTGREVALEEAEKQKQDELGTTDELFAVDLVGYDDNRRDDNVTILSLTFYDISAGIPKCQGSDKLLDDLLSFG